MLRPFVGDESPTFAHYSLAPAQRYCTTRKIAKRFSQKHVFLQWQQSCSSIFPLLRAQSKCVLWSNYYTDDTRKLEHKRQKKETTLFSLSVVGLPVVFWQENFYIVHVSYIHYKPKLDPMILSVRRELFHNNQGLFLSVILLYFCKSTQVKQREENSHIVC